MSMYHKFYIKQMNFELEVVQLIMYLTNFGHVGRLTVEDVDILDK